MPRFDILAVGDHRFPGGTSTALATEIRVLSAAGYRIGLWQTDAPVLRRQRSRHPAIQRCLDAGQATLVPPDVTRLTAGLTLFHNPLVFAGPDPRLPPVRTREALVVAHQPPRDRSGAVCYDAAHVCQTLEAAMGKPVPWAPVSPVCRVAMREAGPLLTDTDWTNVVMAPDWQVSRPPLGRRRPVIGRHSRPEAEKWPADRTTLLQVYPDRPDLPVQMLGAGDPLHDILGGRIPDHWTLFAFNEVPIPEFLAGIDFFVYFHHPDWVEAFGRTVAEAISSGAVAILPACLRPTFGQAALYCEPEDVVPTVEALAADPARYQAQARLAAETLERDFGPAVLLRRVAALAGPPRPARRRRPSFRAPADSAPDSSSDSVSDSGRVPEESLHRVDVALAGDFRGGSEAVWQAAQEARIQAAAGWRTMLLHLPPRPAAGRPEIAPVIERSRSALTRVADPHRSLTRARLLILRQPEAVLRGDWLPPKILPERTLVLLDRHSLADRSFVASFERHVARLERVFGDVTWAVTDASLAGAVRARHPDLKLIAGWRPVVHIEPEYMRRPVTDDRPVPGHQSVPAETFPVPDSGALPAGRPLLVGRLSLSVADQWPAAPERAAADGWRGRILFRALGIPAAPPERIFAGACEVYGGREVDWDGFLRGLDVLYYNPAAMPREVPHTAILWALAHGRPVILPPFLEPVFGPGPVYLPAGRVMPWLARLTGVAEGAGCDAASWAGPAWAGPAWAAAVARRAAGPMHHVSRVENLTAMTAPGPPGRLIPRAAPDGVLFVSSNGVGMGHLTRLLAIARRLPPPARPVFATLSQALPIVRQCGFPAEHLPSAAYSQADVISWNAWLASELARLIPFHRIGRIVFDGSNLYSGLVEALRHRPETALIWIRRAMWRDGQAHVDNAWRAKYCSLVIEPDDIAAAADSGPTAHRADLKVTVPPIRLLNPEECHDRPAAAAALGLDPERPAVLVQLGSGANRDNSALMARIMAALAEWPALQIVQTEWLIARSGGAPGAMAGQPGLRRLRGFPVSRYFAGFDFTIAAAGYNSFNEILSLGLPALFVPNTHATMDAQEVRARFAAAHGAALVWDGHDAGQLQQAIASLRQPENRMILSANALRIAKPNGAATAARLIAETGRGPAVAMKSGVATELGIAMKSGVAMGVQMPMVRQGSSWSGESA